MIKSETGYFFAALLLFFCSCGIDNYIYLYPVVQALNIPSDVDEVYNYVSFRTRDETNQAENSAYFKGFVLYYRIYNNSSARSSDVSSINNYNEDYPATAYNYLISIKSYRKLTAENRRGLDPLIPAASNNRDVVISLIHHDLRPDGITVGAANYGMALRADNLGLPSNLFEFDEINDSDDDVTYNTNWDDENDKRWYVQFYVMAYGYDESYKSLYSEVFDLGYITIRDL
ncbi:hypothetical protein K7I13_00720 [Brucepastera parasyntrophica]|uniref:hypothetical protein n=1 Tax=Brucepastera parasyntrophica TaxID=2880008 RepID=UPI00210E6544|nr:hypothetical protein [Brucepastera parasyntrophica]ULQ59905.1 hypothetical protein K7I13_00720 [Brucepastera parasyntrophica]